MLSLLYFPVALISLSIIAHRGRQRMTDRSSGSFALVVILLLILPFRWGFEISLWDRPIGRLPVALFFIAIFVVLERDDLRDFYLTRKNLGLSLWDGMWVCLLLVIPYVGAQAYINGDRLTLSDWQQAVFWTTPLQVALVEELIFRSLFLGYLERVSFSRTAANSIQSVLFTAGHLRYLEEGSFLAFGFALVFGFVAGWITLRRRNVGGALLAHTVTGWLLLLFFGAQSAA